MFKTQSFKTNEDGKFTLTKKQFQKMVPLEAPQHVGMNSFPHLYIQFVNLEGENAKILWDFSNLKNASEIQKRNKSYPWDYEFIIDAVILPKKKSAVTFVEYQKNGTIIVIQL